ncbi:hypothetical protein AT15_05325 [Kosmotoga arenicorallina S304]|uniref:Dienelactone hydrolase domain-containing protein n=1 Tax=Kosmotoga arenicorallina S304 TaxID=1453497 RepID=A0A176JUI0_9BACT|nr:dienelactone hydrolase family protein [Kosmotoga arenicorallina]OAA27113.1 hypothetical protein AT15_05325 [Kosmotoga arenicorallina S304]
MKSFHAYRNDFFELYSEGKIARALNLADEIEVAYPDMAYKTKFWKARLYSVINEKALAIKALQEMNNMGYWLSPSVLQRSSDLENIKEEPEFHEILNSFKESQVEAMKHSAPLKLEFVPSGSSQNKLPLIVTLHWRLGNAEEFSAFWKGAAQSGKARVLSLQSSQQAGTALYCWDNVEISKKEVSEQVEEYLGIHSSKISQLILSGASQGARLAFELAFEGELTPEKLVLVAPAFRDMDYARELIEKRKGNFKIYIIIGEKDRLFFKNANSIKEMLAENNIPCEMKVYPNMGHTFPDDFDKVLLDILDE